MQLKSSLRIVSLVLFAFLVAINVKAQVKLPKLISNGMVLQGNANVKIWGWSSAHEKIKIEFLDSVYTCAANADGDWFIITPELKPGGPFNMKISANNTIEIKDILIGDVWVCSGQSNMELPISRVIWNYEEEILSYENTEIRQFYVPRKYNFNSPQTDFESGNWIKADAENTPHFSAVAYFFAKELYQKYQIPVGIINSALGGSPIEAWMSEDALKKFPNQYNEAQKFKDSLLIKQLIKDDRLRQASWETSLRAKDKGLANKKQAWYQTNYNSTDWDTMTVPGYWENTALGKVNGAVWFKKYFDVSAQMASRQALLILGCIVDADSVYVNGVFVGNTTYQYPPRRYVLPEGLLKQGKNEIVVRVINSLGSGGFVLDKDYEITSAQGIIDLKGTWQYKLGAQMDSLPRQTFIRWKPVGLFNAMLTPLLNYDIKGVVWYQGESNSHNAAEYADLFPTMIRDWRSKWNQGDFPFIYVQLANYMQVTENPSESDWALLRESQLKTLSVANTAMAVAIDIGEWNDIHPLNKKDVGKRLAMAAQKIAYADSTIISSGPIYSSIKIEGKKIIIEFTETGTGLFAKGGELKEFAIAGADKKFVWAKAVIENNRLMVWSDAIELPVAVRYAWADNPLHANLYNLEMLPASPFRTDNW